jgi:hypothetical protein
MGREHAKSQAKLDDIPGPNYLAPYGLNRKSFVLADAAADHDHDDVLFDVVLFLPTFIVIVTWLMIFGRSTFKQPSQFGPPQTFGKERKVRCRLFCSRFFTASSCVPCCSAACGVVSSMACVRVGA